VQANREIDQIRILPVLVNNNNNNNNNIRIGYYTGNWRLIGIQECRIKPGNAY